TLLTSNRQRSLEFYQQVFGMPIQAQHGNATLLRIGAGRQFIALSDLGLNGVPGIDHICMTVEDFDADRIMRILADSGVSGVAAGKPPLTMWVQTRGPADGGAPEGTKELYFNDPNGITIQLQDASYCGGAGSLGEICSASASSLTGSWS